MNYITSIFKRFVTNDKKILGRWHIEYCDKKINNKVDLSNEDHCGPCGQYRLNKDLLNKDILNKTDLTKVIK
jgi:hypothetical protein